MNSPTLPEAALLFVVVPIIPEVDENERLVAFAAPKIGVIKVGDVAKTKFPEPVEVVIADNRLADDGVPRKVVIPVAKPLTPVLIGNPAQLVNVPDVGVPNNGVINVGEVAKTRLPVPVFVVIADNKFALVGVPKNVAIPVPKPMTPVLIGNPVQFVNVPDVGVPNNGVINVGDVAKTRFPVPVEVVIADNKFAEDGVPKKVAIPVPNPLTPDDIGNPVQLVSVPDVGVPNNGVINVGEVAKTRLPLPVEVVIADNKFVEDGVPKKVAIPVPNPLTPDDIGNPVQFVSVPELGVPRLVPPIKAPLA